MIFNLFSPNEPQTETVSDRRFSNKISKQAESINTELSTAEKGPLGMKIPANNQQNTLTALTALCTLHFALCVQT